MSYTYAGRKRNNSPPPFKGSTSSQPSLSALRSVAEKPTDEQMGHRVDLPDAMRSKMENAFGADLSAVKLYESRAVADAGAQAVAQGSNIAFAPGMLDFSSFGGQALLGHEISHVVSQARGEVSGGGFLNDHALEARADREGAQAAAGQTVRMPSAPMSSVSAAPAAGPMQAKKNWRNPFRRRNIENDASRHEADSAHSPAQERQLGPPLDLPVPEAFAASEAERRRQEEVQQRIQEHIARQSAADSERRRAARQQLAERERQQREAEQANAPQQPRQHFWQRRAARPAHAVSAEWVFDPTPMQLPDPNENRLSNEEFQASLRESILNDTRAASDRLRGSLSNADSPVPASLAQSSQAALGTADAMLPEGSVPKPAHHHHHHHHKKNGKKRHHRKHHKHHHAPSAGG